MNTAVDASQKHLDESHERLRSLASELGLVADRAGQEAARDIIRLTYRVRELGERDHPKDEQDAAHDDVLNAIAAFQLSVRRQLRVPDSDDVLHEDEYRTNTPIRSFEE